MSGFLPPISRVIFFRCLAASTAINLPTWVEPVKVIIRTRGSLSNTLPTSRAGPGTTFNTPGGKPAASNNSAIFMPVTGVSSEGFRTKALPAASARTTFFIASRKGALNGAIPAITPSGCRTVKPNCPAGRSPHFRGRGSQQVETVADFEPGLAGDRAGFGDQDIRDLLGFACEN